MPQRQTETQSYKADIHYFPSFLFHFICKIQLLLLQYWMWNTAPVYVNIHLRSVRYSVKVFLQHFGFGQMLSHVFVDLQCSCVSPAFCLSVHWPTAGQGTKKQRLLFVPALSLPILRNYYFFFKCKFKTLKTKVSNQITVQITAQLSFKLQFPHYNWDFVYLLMNILNTTDVKSQVIKCVCGCDTVFSTDDWTLTDRVL